MAIDSAIKRKSIVAIGLMCVGPTVVPNGAIDSADRSVIGYSYSGASVESALVATGIFSRQSTIIIRLDQDSKIPGRSVESFPEYNILALATADNDIELGAEMEIYSTKDSLADPPVYVRNPSRLAPAINLTCIPAWDSVYPSAHKCRGIAITPRNYLLAQHYHLRPGTTLRYVDLDGNVHDRTVVHREWVYEDLAIGRLDEDLPSTITPASLPPRDFVKYFPYKSYGQPLPDDYLNTVVFFTDAEQKLKIGCLYQLRDSNIQIWASPTYPTFYEEQADGDSGSPAFVVVNGTVVVLFTFEGKTSGTGVIEYRQEIIDYCEETGHTPSTIDLSDFDYRS